MKNRLYGILLAILVVSTLGAFAPRAFSDGTGTWGGSPPAPNGLLVRFHVNADHPTFDANMTRVRQVAADTLVAGRLVEYREFNDSLMANGPLFPHVQLVFANYDAMASAQASLSDLDTQFLEVLTIHARTRP